VKRRDAIALLLLAGVAGGVVAYVMNHVGENVNPVYAVCLAIAAAAVVVLVFAVRSTVDPIPEVGVSELPEPAPFRELVSLEERMSWGAVDRQRFDERVRPHLLRIGTERLRQRHGVRLADAPERARTLMGEELYRFLTAQPDPDGKPVGRRELETVVRQMEAL
jgi:hypothetical protein